ncbi:MAG: glycoside hydrolase family 2 TIM barrel-domain containing protein, partial [Bacteroidota bacterium]|nr:glycoside hydrolase family 2 TIM barrel-domain containing protein [Bacteroidota bacterium]
MKPFFRLPCFLCLCFFCLFSFSVRSEIIRLDGVWQFQTDPDDIGIKTAWFSKTLNETIQLPGSMAENLKGDVPGLSTKWTGSLYDSSFYFNPAFAKYRQEGQVKFPFFLTPDRHYVGAAWYRKEVTIPDGWRGQRIVLLLERSHTETRVWVDGTEQGKDSTMCVPQVFDLSKALKPGKHAIALRIDNRIKSANVGQDAHSLTDQTQGNWNGVVGQLLLNAGSLVFIENVQVYPDLLHHQALLKIQLKNHSNRSAKAMLTVQAKSFNCTRLHETRLLSYPVVIPDTGLSVQMELPMGEGLLTWDEFNPALYNLTVNLASGSIVRDSKVVQFGMREIAIRGKWFYLNGRKIQLRGTVENCCFPLTGYAPMDEPSWERVFRICRKYGLNHMRFHSYCPPEAAFEAADKVGFYLQVEGPSWPNHGSSLGDGKPIDKFLMDETIRLTKAYGNHPSFTMLACGNEPKGHWVKWVTHFVDFWKATDSRRVYTGASVGNSWAWQPANQYHVKAGARGLNWNERPESMSDFRENIDTVSVPYVSHETGQWCAFPDFGEIKKYTGVNKARNFELFQEDLSDHDMGGLGHDFMMASGKLQVLCYKHEIEKIMRTPDYAGFQLLGLNDYSGQGTALVGVLDVFWDEKGYCTAQDFSRFCGPVVPLIRTAKFVYQSDEHLKAHAELSYFGENSYQMIKPDWKLKDANGAVLAVGTLTEKAVEPGNNIDLGDIDIDLSQFDKPVKVTLEVRINTCEGDNSWDFYIYPARKVLPAANNILIADRWSEEVEDKLQHGGDVLLLCNGRVEYGKEIMQTLTPVFWN